MGTIAPYTHVDGSVSLAADDGLWGVYVSGMDEWHAEASQEAAEQHAHALNAIYVGREDKHEHDPRMWATPDLWPFTREQHAVAVVKASGEVQP